MKYYIIVPNEWITKTLIEHLHSNNKTLIPIFNDEGEPTEYSITQASDIYADELVGYKKLSRDEVRLVQASILDGTIEVTEYYRHKGF